MHSDTIGTLRAEVYAEIRELLGQLIETYGIEGIATPVQNTVIERPALPACSELNANHVNGTNMNLLALVEIIRVQSLALAKLQEAVASLESKKAAGGRK